MNELSVNLDELSVRILSAIGQSSKDQVTTTDVKHLTGVDDNSKIKYRFEKLSDAGLIELWQPEPQNNLFPPKHTQITEKGLEYLDSMQSESPEGDDVRQRMDQVLSQQQEILTRLNELESMLGTDGNQEIPEESVEYGRMVKGFIAVEKAMEDEFGINLKRYTKN